MWRTRELLSLIACTHLPAWTRTVLLTLWTTIFFPLCAVVAWPSPEGVLSISLNSEALLDLACYMLTLKNVPVEDSWCDPVASEVSGTGAPTAGMSLYDCGISRVEALGMHGLPFSLSVQPSHGVGLAMMQHCLPTPCPLWSLLDPKTFLLTILVRIWPHYSCGLATKKFKAKCILVSVTSPLGLSEMTSLLSLNIYEFFKRLGPLPYLICVSIVNHLRSLEGHI